MRKLLYIVISALACLPVFGQEIGRGIAVSNTRTEISDTELGVAFSLKASGLRLGSDDMVTLEFAVEDDTHRVVLPVVSYCGNRRYHYEQRRNLLSDGHTTAPRHIYKGIEAMRDYASDYHIAMPWQEWMEHAALTWREYRHDCTDKTVAGNGILIADLCPVSDGPQVWLSDAELFPSLVSFLAPEVEEVKARASMIELFIDFPVNDTRVQPDFRDNRRELARADSLVNVLNANSLINIHSVGIHGYASPEGTYATNKRLADERSRSFKQYLATTYPHNRYMSSAFSSSTAEDWAGIARIIEQMEIPSKPEILAVINDASVDSDAKSRILLNIPWWNENRKYIENTLFAGLRRIELKIDYTVENLSNDRARELLYIDPNMLSLDEMYRVAKEYDPESHEYLEIYEIAAQTFPNDFVANNNAAAALLQQGFAERAYPYILKMGAREESYVNLGAYYYVMGDLGLAVEYFNKAKMAGHKQGETNLQKIR